MSNGAYKHWTKEYRNRSYNMVKKAVDLGWIKPNDICNRCGQTEGIIHLHCENYDTTTNILSEALKRKPTPSITDEEKAKINSNDTLEVLCWRCHMMHHSSRRSPAEVAKYFADIKDGKHFMAVRKHDFNILATDHGVK